ncbi:MAG TPA: Hsp20/alpha crystallin family protein [bacterium]|nr:Hsp20/alpha crystallin family protein [bacterium]
MPYNKWDPLQDLISLHQELFGEGPEFGITESPGSAWSPAVDIYETSGSFVIKAEVPGINPDKIKVEYRDRHLVISGERPARKMEQSRKYHHVERTYGPFERVFSLPYNVDCEAIEAQYQDGVIEVTIPKSEENSRKCIEVKG